MRRMRLKRRFRGKILEPSSIDSVLLVRSGCDVCTFKKNEWKRLIEMHQHVKSLNFIKSMEHRMKFKVFPFVKNFSLSVDKNEPLVYKGERTSTVISTCSEKLECVYKQCSSSVKEL